MLEITVIACPDPDYEGTWRFNKNQVYIGYPDGDISPKGELPSYAFLVEVLPDFLQVQPGAQIEFWRLNDKRATKARRVKLGDLLQVGDIKLTINSAQYHEELNKKQLLDKRLEELVSQNSPLLELIYLLNEKTK